jgi:zinc transport system substrate-binding protein
MRMLLGSLIIFFAMGIAEAKEIRVVTSFYPIYTIALNVTKDVPGVSVSNLTPGISGCLHDYALNPSDMQKLSTADIFVVSGAGMEAFLEEVARQYPKLEIFRLSDRVPLLDGNPHVWLSISGAIMQTKNLGLAMAGIDPENSEFYRKNTDTYVVKLEALGLKMYKGLLPFKGSKVITLHDAFPYLAEEFGLDIVAVVEGKPGAEPSAKELSEIIELIKAKKVRAILSEEWYPVPSLETISRETGIGVYFVNAATKGPSSPDAYLQIMQKNLETLEEALK